MFNPKKFKIVKSITKLKPRIKWLMYSKLRELKINANCVDLICEDNNISKTDKKLKQTVELMLKKEFSDKIQDYKSYETLVEAIIYNYKKKQLEAQED